MGGVLAVCNGLGLLNAGLLAVGRWIGAFCMAGMVVVILTQVVFRYGLNAALPWPEELSRFLMLWATGLMAPTAFRRGGFVAIDMGTRLLPRGVAAVLATILLSLACLILWVGLTIAWSEVTGLGGRFETDSLRVPMALDLSVWMKVPKSWMMSSMLVGLALLFLVALELILRNIVAIFGAQDRLRHIPETIILGAE